MPERFSIFEPELAKTMREVFGAATMATPISELGRRLLAGRIIHLVNIGVTDRDALLARVLNRRGPPTDDR